MRHVVWFRRFVPTLTGELLVFRWKRLGTYADHFYARLAVKKQRKDAVLLGSILILPDGVPPDGETQVAAEDDCP